MTDAAARPWPCPGRSRLGYVFLQLAPSAAARLFITQPPRPSQVPGSRERRVASTHPYQRMPESYNFCREKSIRRRLRRHRLRAAACVCTLLTGRGVW